jgi:DNA-binding MarR family transcriptional regulator
MERLGYVKRLQVPGNRKTVYVHLTASGRALERRLVPLAKATNRAAVRGLPASDVAAAKRVLVAVSENLLRGRATKAQESARRAPHSNRELRRRERLL